MASPELTLQLQNISEVVSLEFYWLNSTSKLTVCYLQLVSVNFLFWPCQALTNMLKIGVNCMIILQFIVFNIIYKK